MPLLSKASNLVQEIYLIQVNNEKQKNQATTPQPLRVPTRSGESQLAHKVSPQPLSRSAQHGIATHDGVSV